MHILRTKVCGSLKKAMSELFGVDKSGISRHLKNIFSSGELDEEVVVAKIETTTQYGAIKGKTPTSETKYYNLDVIISVGYRVNSKKATQFCHNTTFHQSVLFERSLNTQSEHS